MSAPALDPELRERLRRLVIRTKGRPIWFSELMQAIGPRPTPTPVLEDVMSHLAEQGVEVVPDEGLT